MNILKSFKKLNREKIEELKARERMVNEYLLTAQAIKLQKDLWLNNELKALGVDIEKQWNVDYKTGKIIPIEPKKDGDKLDKRI